MGTADLAQEVTEIAKKYDMRAVCTYDAFKAYCEEANERISQGYSLYNWTKALCNPDGKYQKSFAFYRDNDQIYSKDVAEALYEDLLVLN